MNTTPAGNEAELQASLVVKVRAALPLLPANIKLERYLKLRLGHRALNIDGTAIEPGVIHGRYDVLVLLEDTPLVLAELKAPEEDVTEDDVRQALSYAGLHRPMVPLVLVTNGKKHLLRQTFDGKELDPSIVGAEQLKDALKAASALAAGSVEQAIRTLLGASGKVWSGLLTSWTDETVSALNGGVRDFARPIPREFVIPRRAVKEIEDRLAAGARVVVLHGPPLSGVTNALAQYARGDQTGTTLFVDGRSVPDVLQFMANRLTRELVFPVSKDDLRGWLNARRGLLDLRLAIDGLPREGVEELVEFANAGLVRLVLGLGSADYRKAAAVEGRSEQSPLGRSAASVELLPLSDEEFFESCEVLERSFGAGFYRGAEHVPDLRHPRKLRVIVSTLPSGPIEKGSVRETVIMLPPIPGPQTLRAFSRGLVPDAELRFGLQKVAEAFLADAEQHVRDPDWVAATWGRPSVDPAQLEADLGQARIGRLCDLGFLSWVTIPDLGPRLLVRIEELLADSVAEIWAAGLTKTKNETALTAEVERLLRLTFVVPSGEVALALAIFLASRRSDNVLGIVVPFLISRKPTVSKLSAGARVYLLVKDARISLEFGEGTAEKTLGGLDAWVVLSHLASWNMAADGCDATVNFTIFSELGAAPHLIFYPRPIEPNLAPGFHFHDFEGVGSVLCLSTGIVEPLVQAMLGHASEYPQEFVWLAGLAMERRDFHLAWRLLTVARIAQSMVDEDIAAAAQKVEKVLDEWWKEFLAVSVRQHSPPVDPAHTLPTPGENGDEE
jgi:hypothetical protein